MKASELVGRRCEGDLNGEPGTIIRAVDPDSLSQGTGIDCLVHWDVSSLEDEWNDAGDLTLV